MSGEDSLMYSRLGVTSESRPNETNLGRGRPDCESPVSSLGRPGCDLLDEMELASEMVSSSRRREEAGMVAVVVGAATRVQSAPGTQRNGYDRSYGRGRGRGDSRRVQRTNRLEETFEYRRTRRLLLLSAMKSPVPPAGLLLRPRKGPRRTSELQFLHLQQQSARTAEQTWDTRAKRAASDTARFRTRWFTGSSSLRFGKAVCSELLGSRHWFRGDGTQRPGVRSAH